MTTALITPEVLQWAREKAHLTTIELADKTKIKVEKIESWERGAGKPTLNQAHTLAKTLRIPFGYLFLSTPPEEKPLLPDLRTLRDEDRDSFSQDFLELLNSVLQKHQWYRDHLQEEGATPLTHIGSFGLNDRPEEVARDISIYLGVDDLFRREALHWDDFLRKIIRRSEEKGILVLRSGIVGNNTKRKLSVEDFRGFAICDELAPLIFINSRDSKAAQVFTFAHEIAHLWIGFSGISNPDTGYRISRRPLQTEIFCNKVAAELLTPYKSFVIAWEKTEGPEENIHRLVRLFRVSSIVVLRRAYDLDLISKNDFFNYYERELKKQERKPGGGGGNFYNTLLTRNGRRFTHALVAASMEGRTLYRDAASLLGVKVKHLETIAHNLGIR